MLLMQWKAIDVQGSTRTVPRSKARDSCLQALVFSMNVYIEREIERPLGEANKRLHGSARQP